MEVIPFFSVGKLLLLILFPHLFLYMEAQPEKPYPPRQERYTIVTEGVPLKSGDFTFWLKTAVGINQKRVYTLTVLYNSEYQSFILNEDERIYIDSFSIIVVELSEGLQLEKPYITLDIRYIDH